MTSKSRKLLHDKIETGFTIVFMIFLVILLMSVMLFVANMFSYPKLDETIAASPKTPWGIVTSLFVHTDEAHLFNNMIALFLFLLFLVVSNVFLPIEEIKTRI